MNSLRCPACTHTLPVLCCVWWLALENENNFYPFLVFSTSLPYLLGSVNTNPAFWVLFSFLQCVGGHCMVLYRAAYVCPQLRTKAIILFFGAFFSHNTRLTLSVVLCTLVN